MGGDAKTDMNEGEKEAEKEDGEQTTDETTEDKVIIEKEKTNKSYRSFIAKMFKRDSVSDKKGEEPVKMENEEKPDKPEEQPKEEEEEKVVEDKTTTETKEEEKEPTPNTSF